MKTTNSTTTKFLKAYRKNIKSPEELRDKATANPGPVNSMPTPNVERKFKPNSASIERKFKPRGWR